MCCLVRMKIWVDGGNCVTFTIDVLIALSAVI